MSCILSLQNWRVSFLSDNLVIRFVCISSVTCMYLRRELKIEVPSDFRKEDRRDF